ncbi:LysM peptidoglycan-binding domain-containing protein [Croceivirga radicis]|uniref:LysM peptidoglycan-binding domain-containing protein n=1 Tax=Croceivirga radicis TaxID=1929488 RepID=UPI000255ACEC|nr:LysM peptidoglycan-binding domain-containing protein [Croceivirga radicis]
MIRKRIFWGIVAPLGILTATAQETPQKATEQDSTQTTTVLNDTPLNIPAIAKKQELTTTEEFEQAYVYDSLWLKELRDNHKFYDEMYAEVVRINYDSIFAADLPTDTLKARLQRLNAKTPFNVEYNPYLEQVIQSFLKRKRGLIHRMITASQFYFPLFEQELDIHNIPLEMKYLAIVESALNPTAKSRVGATGLWQFMFGTGKMYGLDVSSYVDERSDPIASTQAAGKYLSKLYSIFNDWDLALAAYNSGPGNVNKAIRRSGGHTNYWNIRPFLPRETANYVPLFLATMYMFEYADEHGIVGLKADRPYFETDTVHVKNMIGFEHISKLVKISEEELKFLNPSYKLDIIPKVDGKTYPLRLPLKHIGAFVSNEDSIYSYAKSEFEKKEKTLPELVTSTDRVRYKVRSGDYLGKIAERFGVGVSQIKRWNGLRNNNLKVGQRLVIYPRKPVAVATTTSKKSTTPTTTKPIKLPSDPSKIHVVQSGDSLWTISRQYPGITIDNLRKWNGLSNNNLKPGTKLKLCNCSS